MNNILKKKLKLEVSALVKKNTCNLVLKSRVIHESLVECTCQNEDTKENMIHVFFKNNMVHFISDQTIFKSIIYRK